MFTRRLALAGIVSAGLLVLTAIPLAAQDRPDFSGTWVVEQVEMQRPERGDALGEPPGRRGGSFGGGGGFEGRGGRQGRGAAFDAMFAKGDRISIRQTSSMLIVNDERRSRISSYPFDGRTTSNPGAGDSTVKTTTRWDGVALVTKNEQTMPGPQGQGERTMTLREVRTLTADRRTMTLVVTPEGFPGGRTTVTFARADEGREAR